MTLQFYSSKSLLLGLLFVTAATLASYYFGFLAIRTGNWGLLLIWAFINTVLATIWFGVRYVVGPENLVVKIGPLTERTVPISEIYSIQRSYELRNSGSGPSFKKLKVKYRGGEVLITPAREEEFLNFLKNLNPAVFIDLSMVTSL